MNEYTWQEYCNRVHKLEKRVKALEQKPVLDKIRTEVEQLPITNTAIRLVTEIIDKYKAESEEEK